MNLCDIQTIRPVLARHGFHFSKALGQNFLTASWVPEQIAQASGADEHHGVLEIGPGFGALTQELCEQGGPVLALELDRRLLPVLRETVGQYPNLTVTQGDVCKADLPALTREYLPGLPVLAVANLPYSVTSPALTALLEAGVFERITVMVQREVAQRICSEPGKPEYGSFSVFAQTMAVPECLFEVPPDCFTPKPKVFSTVLTLTPHTNPPVPEDERLWYFRVVRAAFAQRRKTLLNALCAGLALPKEAAARAITNAGLSPQVRGETLGIEEFLNLSRHMRGELHK